MGGLTDLVSVVNESSVVNIAQLMVTKDGKVLVPTYDWQSLFAEHCTKITGIKKLHHLRFDSAMPGCVFVKERSEEKRKILKKGD